jgi:hypothetical protein
MHKNKPQNYKTQTLSWPKKPSSVSKTQQNPGKKYDYVEDP